MNQGKYIIATMLLLGLAAAAASFWHHRQASRRVLEYWGPENSQQILRASKVTALRFGEGGPADGSATNIVEERDATPSRGVANIRQALVQDAAYDWDGESLDEIMDWQYALRFSGPGDTGDGPLTVLFSFDPPALSRDAGRSVPLDKSSAQVFKAFLDEQFTDSK
jgi:hypothetical protein